MKGQLFFSKLILDIMLNFYRNKKELNISITVFLNSLVILNIMF